MTHEELIARLREDDTDFWHCEAADRIEALRAELEAYRNSHLHADKLLLQEKARAERLEAALREIIDEDQHQSEWRYWEKEDGHWARKARAALEPVAAPDPAAIREAALREAAAVISRGGLHTISDRADAILALIQKGAADGRA